MCLNKISVGDSVTDHEVRSFQPTDVSHTVKVKTVTVLGLEKVRSLVFTSLTDTDTRTVHFLWHPRSFDETEYESHLVDYLLGNLAPFCTEQKTGRFF